MTVQKFVATTKKGSRYEIERHIRWLLHDKWFIMRDGEWQVIGGLLKGNDLLKAKDIRNRYEHFKGRKILFAPVKLVKETGKIIWGSAICGQTSEVSDIQPAA